MTCNMPKEVTSMPEGMIQVSFNVSRFDWERFRALAEGLERSRAGLLRRLVQHANAKALTDVDGVAVADNDAADELGLR